MPDEECEIEYLDEDEDVIQQFVIAGQKPAAPSAKIEESTTDCESDEINSKVVTKIKERGIKRKALKRESDSDYDPSEDMIVEQEAKKLKPIQKRVPNIKSRPPKLIKSLAVPIKDMRSELERTKNLEYNERLKESTTDCESDEINSKVVRKEKERGIKRKALKRESDSDYDPSEDMIVEQEAKKLKPIQKHVPNIIKSRPPKIVKNLAVPIKDMRSELESPKNLEYNERKKFKIRIPDFEDPLCLPVRAIKNDETDLKRLNNWNKICLEQLHKIDLEPKKSTNIIRSTKIAMFRNVKPLGNKTETMAYFRTKTVSEGGERRLEQCQSILPKFREKAIWRSFDAVRTHPRTFCHRNEVLLTKEKHNNEEVLVVYKPRDSTTTVTKMVEEDRGGLIPPRQVLEEAVLTRMCAPCYQMSWRGARKVNNAEMQCKICSREFGSVYSLLTHLKTHHKDVDVRRYRADLSRTVAKSLSYHYKCRVCQLNCVTIKQLRRHIVTHKGDEVFKCEVGNHIAS